MAMDEWLMWQLADSALPIGGLAHSNGLEAAVQHGLVTDGKTFEDFVGVSIQQCAQGVLRFVRRTCDAPSDFELADTQCDWFLNNHVTNRASRAQGRAFLAATARIFETAPAMVLVEQIRRLNSPAHFAPVFGLVCGSLDLGFAQTESLFLYILLRSSVGSAVRLGIVGPLEAQRIQSRIKPRAMELRSQPVHTAPVLDLLQATQDRLYSRLFQS